MKKLQPNEAIQRMQNGQSVRVMATVGGSNTLFGQSFDFYLDTPTVDHSMPEPWARERLAQKNGAKIMACAGPETIAIWGDTGSINFNPPWRYQIHPDHDPYFDEQGNLKKPLPPIEKRECFRERVAFAYGATIQGAPSHSRHSFVDVDPYFLKFNADYIYKIHPLQDYLFDENGVPK